MTWRGDVRVWRAGPGTGRDRTGQDVFESLLTMLVATKGEERLPGTGTPLPYGTRQGGHPTAQEAGSESRSSHAHVPDRRSNKRVSINPIARLTAVDDGRQKQTTCR